MTGQKPRIGTDLSKWLIQRDPYTRRWCICPPWTSSKVAEMAGRTFRTGAEALAAFNRGAKA